MVEQNGTTEIVYGLGGGKLALMNGQTLAKAFVGLPAGAVAVYASGGLSYFRHPDWLGSSRISSDPSHNIVSGLAYAPYGETYSESGTPDRSFTGQNQDTISNSTTGLYDFLYRRYAQYGRWISPDPAGLAAVTLTVPQSLNRYAYTWGSPLNFVDPLGLRIILVCTGEIRDGGCYRGRWIAIDTDAIDRCVFAGTCGTGPGETGGGGDKGGKAANTGTISAIHGYEGSKKQFCDQQSNMAALNALLPGLANAIQGDYRAIAATTTSEVAQDVALDTAAKNTSLLLTVRSWTGLPMSVTSKILRGVGYVGTAVNLYDAMKAMQKEYAACMQ